MAVKEKTNDKPSRIIQYLKETHKWENYVFLILSVTVLVLGCLILTGTLTVKENMWLIGGHSKGFGWTLVSLAGVFTIYALYPFFKPALPEFKKITWLTFGKFVGNSIRTLLFITVFALLFFLYDSFITEILSRILN